MDEGSRPLDMLNEARNRTVMIDLKNGYRYIGKLKAFDIHINMVLEDAEEHLIKTKKIVREIDGKTKEEEVTAEIQLKRKLGKVFIRGDMVTMISPA